MTTLIISDIFGCTEHLLKLSKDIGATHIISPYSKATPHFVNEAEAYQYFCQHHSVSSYHAKLSDYLEQNHTIDCVIGFSVGASALWQYSQTNTHRLRRGIGFYGSQIRHQVTIPPSIPLTLILPNQEPHFSVLTLSNQLEKLENVSLIQTEFGHGFMNPLSKNYHPDALKYYRKKLKIFVNSATTDAFCPK